MAAASWMPSKLFAIFGVGIAKSELSFASVVAMIRLCYRLREIRNCYLTGVVFKCVRKRYAVFSPGTLLCLIRRR